MKLSEIKLQPWLDVVKNPNTRPKYIFDIDDKNFEQPYGMVATVYKYTNLNNGRIYIGIHKESDKPYHTSSKDTDFLQDKAERGAKFKFEILSWGSVGECEDIENNLLESVDAANNPLYYNKWNGKPGVKKKDKKFQNEITKELFLLRKGKTPKNKIKLLSADCIQEPKTFLKLYNEYGLAQIRDEQINDDNVADIKDAIINNYGDIDYPIYLKDRYFEGEFYPHILISGNHTIFTPVNMKEHFQYESTEYIVIPKTIHEGYTDADWRAVGNNMNVKTQVIGKTYNEWDALKEAIDAYEDGNSYCTEDDKTRWRMMGVGKKINWIIKKVQEHIVEKKQRGKGMVRVNYSTPEGKAILSKKVKERKKDNRLILDMASGTPSLHRILNEYLKQQQKRFEDGLELYDEIYVFVHHSSRIQIESFKTLKNQVLNHKEFFNNINIDDEFKSKMHGKIITPNIEFEELPLYMKGARLQSLLLKQQTVA
jgi:hypothetical protein